MATQVPPKRATAFSFEVSLVSQADTDVFQTSVTLAAGDVVVYKDGVLDGNIDTLPTEIGTSGVLVVALSAAEMTADRVTVRFHDVAGDQWQDLLVTLHTVTTSQIDDLATAAALAVVDGNVDLTLVDLGGMDLKLDDLLLDTGTDGVVLANNAITAAKIATDAITSDELAASALAEIADAVHDEVVENSYTLRQILRLLAAAVCGEAIGGGTATITFYGLDGVTDRIVATVDANGNRSSMTLDVT
jgi:hypothetical protein